MNSKQARVVKLNSEQARVVKGIRPNIGKPRRYYVDGKGGVGKSFIIDGLTEGLAPDQYFKTTKTNMAAQNIGGLTYFAALGMGITKGYDKPPVDCSNLLLFILDEGIMVSKAEFERLEERLRFCKKCDEPFGGVTFVILGDLLQLGPIGDWIFKSPLWKFFEFQILTQSMRHSEDPEFGARLDRWREGTFEPEDAKFLESRQFHSELRSLDDYKAVADKFLQLPEDENIMVLAHENRDVDAINNEIIEKKFAVDKLYVLMSEETTKWSEGNEIKNVFHFNAARSMRVVLRRNIKQPKKNIKQGKKNGSDEEEELFCNGETGTIVSFVKYPNSDEILNVMIKVDGHVPLLKLYRNRMDNKAKSKARGVKVVDFQFPIRPAYASTVHRAQGLTLDQVIVITDCMPPSLFYVSVSRVRCGAHLHVLYVDEKVVKAHPEAKAEYKKIMEYFGIKVV